MAKLKNFIKKNPSFTVFLVLAVLLVAAAGVRASDRHSRSL